MSTNYWPKYSSSLHDYLAALDVSVFYGIIKIIKDKILCVPHLHGLASIYYIFHVRYGLCHGSKLTGNREINITVLFSFLLSSLSLSSLLRGWPIIQL